MLELLKQIESLYGFSPLRYIQSDKAPYGCHYDWSKDEIYICTVGRTSLEQAFCVLHEYRHMIQVKENIFPQIKTITLDELPNDSSYLDLPWEQDANDWALRKGFVLGLWDSQWKPRWIQNPALIKGWKQ